MSFEQKSAVEPRQSIRDTVIFGLFRAINRLEHRKMLATSRREAERYEKQAAEHPDTVIQRSNLLLSAGQAYLNARMPDKAVVVLEAAQPDVESHKQQGLQYGFLALARLYQTLGAAYRLAGRPPEDQEVIQCKAETLAIEMEELFGISTEFSPDGSRMTYATPEVDGSRAA